MDGLVKERPLVDANGSWSAIADQTASCRTAQVEGNDRSIGARALEDEAHNSLPPALSPDRRGIGPSPRLAEAPINPALRRVCNEGVAAESMRRTSSGSSHENPGACIAMAPAAKSFHDPVWNRGFSVLRAVICCRRLDSVWVAFLVERSRISITF